MFFVKNKCQNTFTLKKIKDSTYNKCIHKITDVTTRSKNCQNVFRSKTNRLTCNNNPSTKMNVIVKSKNKVLYVHNKNSIETSKVFENLVESLKIFAKKYFDEDFLNFQIKSNEDQKIFNRKIISYFKMAEIEIICTSSEQKNMTEIYKEWAHSVLIDDVEYFGNKIDQITLNHSKN